MTAPDARALEAAVLRHEAASLQRALRTLVGTLAVSQARLAVASHERDGTVAALRSAIEGSGQHDEELAAILGSRTFRTWRAVSGFDRRRRRGGAS